VSGNHWELLKADFKANAPALSERAGPSAVAAAAARNGPTVRFVAVALFRLAQSAGAFFAPLGSAFKQLNHVVTGCDIAYQAQIGPGLVLYHPTGVVIGPGCAIGARARIMQGVTIGSDAVIVGERDGGSPVVGDDVFIGPGAAVFGPVRLGDRVRVGANAVVTSSFPDDVTVAGAPARVVSDRVEQ
jgi:serine O-acetyltransferase